VFALVLVKDVRAFQKKHKLEVDGIYGKTTHAVLTKAKTPTGRLAWDKYCDYLMEQVVVKPPEQIHRERVVSAFMYAYSRRPLHYTMGAGRDDYLLGKPELTNYPRQTDCSGMYTWCFWVRGYRDPNGLDYRWVGYTGTLIGQGHRVTAPDIGDAVFYGRNSAGDPTHVAMYVGKGMVLSHGSEGGPRLLEIRYRHDMHSIRTYF
jgi:hypothetical protein